MPHTPQWFEYDWPLDGRPARFVVDLALSGVPHDGRPVLLYVSCESKRGKADALSGLESARAEAVCKKLCKALAPYYAGFIETGAQRQYYFYMKERAMLEDAERIAGKEHFLLCRAGCAEEPHWATYQKLLYPDSAKLQTEENRKRIELMLAHGDSPAVARRVSLFLFFSTEATMLLFPSRRGFRGMRWANLFLRRINRLPMAFPSCASLRCTNRRSTSSPRAPSESQSVSTGNCAIGKRPS